MKIITFIAIISFTINIHAQNINDEIIEIKTTEGSIIIELDSRRAPLTVSNFIKLTKLNPDFLAIIGSIWDYKNGPVESAKLFRKILVEN